MRRSALVLAAVTAAAVPCPALADVPVAVPTAFLGGPIWSPLPAVTIDAAGRPSLAPAANADLCRGFAAGDCAVVGPGADVETVPLPAPGPAGPGVDDGSGVADPVTDPAADPDGQAATALQTARPATRVIPAMPPTADLLQAYGGLRFPGPADWLPWQRPTLRWAATPGAGYYNVQIFRGQRRVLNAWSEDARLSIPKGVLRQGRSYVWVVWPASGPRRAARYGQAVGRSTFAVTLRPRIVFHRPGTGRGAMAEVRPHIPFGTLRLRRPGALSTRVPRTVTLDGRGRFVLPIAPRAAERLGAALIGRGPTPPVGLRGPGL
ncbi:MAG TPA: hypothetical protein PKD59_00825 [Miltoncostaeaceae bacterium]|nr:hypothetical protein [Miltoncostaeaceae bacterium]